MAVVRRSEIEREKHRMDDSRDELVERIGRALPQDGFVECFSGFYVARSAKRTKPVLFVHEPAFCVIAQGRKRVHLADETFRYDTGHYLIVTVDLPLAFEVEQASDDEPYFGLRVDLDPSLVASVIMESGVPPKQSRGPAKAIAVSAMDADLFDAVVRLMRLVDHAGQRRVLASLITREIILRLLTGGQSARLSHLLTAGGETRRIARAIAHLRQHFNKPLEIDAVASQAAMSVSGFHHHFKAVTGLSPLQFQKQIRLQEARRLMLGEKLDAATAGARVGYEDASYFSRDYRRLFGAPPQRDIARLRDDLQV
jgi:AraC-like DNA-binding protein